MSCFYGKASKCVRNLRMTFFPTIQFPSLGSLTAEGYLVLSWLLIMYFPLFSSCNVLTDHGRGVFMKSERSDSFTSLAGQITGFLTMPQGCWDSSGRSNPRAHPTQGHWWCTAGKWHAQSLWKEAPWAMGVGFLWVVKMLWNPIEVLVAHHGEGRKCH